MGKGKQKSDDGFPEHFRFTVSHEYEDKDGVQLQRMLLLGS